MNAVAVVAASTVVTATVPSAATSIELLIVTLQHYGNQLFPLLLLLVVGCWLLVVCCLPLF